VAAAAEADEVRPANQTGGLGIKISKSPSTRIGQLLLTVILVAAIQPPYNREHVRYSNVLSRVRRLYQELKEAARASSAASLISCTFPCARHKRSRERRCCAGGTDYSGGLKRLFTLFSTFGERMEVQVRSLVSRLGFQLLAELSSGM